GGGGGVPAGGRADQERSGADGAAAPRRRMRRADLSECCREPRLRWRRGLERDADDGAGGGGGGHEVDAGGSLVEGGPESDRAVGPVSAWVPAALLAEVVVAQVVGRPPG